MHDKTKKNLFLRQISRNEPSLERDAEEKIILKEVCR
jgi:hypothetical protein